MVQLARPILDVAVGSWSRQDGVTSNLYTAIDEVVASDTDYIQSSASPAVADIVKVRLGSMTDPASSAGHHVRYRYQKSVTGGDQINLTVRLKQGSTEIASWTHTNISTGYTDADQTLSGPQADAITDYTILDLWFEAVKVAAVFASDTFTGSDNQDLDAHTATLGGPWVLHGSYASKLKIFSNRCRPNGSTLMYITTAPASADYDVLGDVIMLTDDNVITLGVCGRIDTAANTFYLARYNPNGNKWQLFKFVAGVSTQLGSDAAQTLTPSQAYALKLQMRGTTIKVFVDSVEIISVTDSSISVAGKAGIRGSSATGTTTGLTIDNFQAVDA